MVSRDQQNSLYRVGGGVKNIVRKFALRTLLAYAPFTKQVYALKIFALRIGFPAGRFRPLPLPRRERPRKKGDMISTAPLDIRVIMLRTCTVSQYLVLWLSLGSVRM